MSTSIFQSLSSQVGLAGVELIHELEAPQLPAFSSIAPSEEAMEAHLPLLLGAPMIDARILAALRPFLRHRDILGPKRWGELADGAPEALEEAAAAFPDASQKQTLHSAAALLREEKGLRELLSLHRHTLHKA